MTDDLPNFVCYSDSLVHCVLVFYVLVLLAGPCLQCIEVHVLVSVNVVPMFLCGLYYKI